MEARMHKQLLWVSLALSISLVACATSNHLFAKPPSPEEEEQAVYSVLLGEYQGQKVILYDSTESGFEDMEDDAVPEYVHNAAPNAEGDTLENYLVRNDASHPLPKKLRIGVDYQLMSHKQMDEIFNSSEDAWTEFYKRYPGSPGIITFSRVGFNQDFSEALVYMARQSDYLAGTGSLIRLQKQNGVWKIMEEIGLWIS
jgi:hypothetical protein